jgi:hypothetical protein
MRGINNSKIMQDPQKRKTIEENFLIKSTALFQILNISSFHFLPIGVGTAKKLSVMIVRLDNLATHGSFL